MDLAACPHSLFISGKCGRMHTQEKLHWGACVSHLTELKIDSYLGINLCPIRQTGTPVSTTRHSRETLIRQNRHPQETYKHLCTCIFICTANPGAQWDEY